MNEEPQGVVVRLLVFSGRPDPEWTLAAPEVERLEERVRGAVKGERAAPAAPGGLGYRGFLVRNRADVGGLPDQFTVFGGVLAETSDQRRRHWRDTTGIEAFLLERAREEGYGDVLERFGVEGPGPR